MIILHFHALWLSWQFHKIRKLESTENQVQTQIGQSTCKTTPCQCKYVLPIANTVSFKRLTSPVDDWTCVFVIRLLCSQTTSLFTEHVDKEMFNSVSKLANFRENNATQGYQASWQVTMWTKRKFVQWTNCVVAQIMRRHVEICRVEKLVA